MFDGSIQDAARTMSEHGWESQLMDLSTKVAVVTGSGRGIGMATSVELARQGVRAVAAVDMSEDVERFATDGNSRLGREVFIPFRGDVCDSEFRRRVFQEMEARFGAVSVCVPCAGITRDKLAVKVAKDTGESMLYPESDWQRVIDVDLTAPVYWAIETIASVARDRHRRGLARWEPSESVQGAIIFIGSVSSTGNRGQVSYATAKAGLQGAQATLASEAIYYGVRSAIIHPGYTDTPMVQSLGDDFIRDFIVPRTQLRRLIRPEEIAHAIVFMVRNSSVSGKLWADGGWFPTT